MTTSSTPPIICHGIDVGGTKIELVSFDTEMQELHRQRIDTPRNGYSAFLDALFALIAEADDALDSAGCTIGIGLPGVREHASGRQLSANIPSLTGHRVAADLAAHLQRPLRLGNDSQCFAASEANGGAAHGYPSMAGVILGTGAGGAFCLGGRLVSGHNGIASEWGHWSLPAHQRDKYHLPLLDCGCGLHGCLERYVSGTGLANLHRYLGGVSPDATRVIAAADTGESSARQALAIHLDLLGHALACLVMALDPHVIVLGGGLSRYAPLYSGLPAAMQPHLFAGMQVPPIVPPRFGDAGGARGAAMLARYYF